MAKRVRGNQPLSAYLNDQVEDLRRLAAKAMKWDAEAIHHTRVTTRRLSASFDLLEPVLANDRSREFMKSLKRLRKAMGPLRNLDVMLLHLGELATRRKCSAGVEWLAREFQQQRMEKRRRCVRKCPGEEVLAHLGSWWGLEQRVRESELAAHSLMKRRAPAQLREFALNADGIVQSRDDDGDQDLHALRLEAKRLRYTIELAEPIGYSVPSSVIRSFKKLQDAMGLWHDYVVLGREALDTALRRDLAVKRGRLYGEVLEVARACQQRSQRHFDQFVKLWKQDGPTIVRRVQQIFRPTAEQGTADDREADSINGESEPAVSQQEPAQT